MTGLMETQESKLELEISRHLVRSDVPSIVKAGFKR